MLFTEFNMEDALDVRGEEKFAEGKQAGLAEGKAVSILELLEELGPVPSDLRDAIMSQQNLEVLTQWHKLAAKCNKITEFQSLIQ